MNDEARLLLPSVPQGYPRIVVADGIRYFTNGDSPICDACEGPVDGGGDGDALPTHCVRCTFSEVPMGTCPKCDGVSISDDEECWYCQHPRGL